MIAARGIAAAAVLVAASAALPAAAGTCTTIVANDARSQYAILTLRVLPAKGERGKLVYDGLDRGEIYPGREAAVSWECGGQTENYKLTAYPSGPGKVETLPATPDGKMEFTMK